MASHNKQQSLNPQSICRMDKHTPLTLQKELAPCGDLGSSTMGQSVPSITLTCIVPRKVYLPCNWTFWSSFDTVPSKLYCCLKALCSLGLVWGLQSDKVHVIFVRISSRWPPISMQHSKRPQISMNHSRWPQISTQHSWVPKISLQPLNRPLISI